MIIGNGDIASVLPDRDDLLFFASGVSNSQEADPLAYQREMDLLLAQPTDAHLVYFGSLAIFYSDTPYTRHKRAMEATVQDRFETSTIFRIGNIAWGNNPHTLINYFRNEIAEGHPIEVRDEERYVVDKEEFLHWIGKIPTWSCEMNVPGERLSVAEIASRVKNGEI